MRRFTLTTLAVLTVLMFTAGIALAAITFHSGPTVTFSGNTATATFNVSGLGKTPAYAFLDVSGTATYECVNNGGQTAPGQTIPAQSAPSPGVQLSNSQKNGRDDVTVSSTLTAPATTDAQAAGCPNKPGNWTGQLVSVTITSATLRIEQPLGTIIYGPTTFTNP